jgi:hypothetical protein
MAGELRGKGDISRREVRKRGGRRWWESVVAREEEETNGWGQLVISKHPAVNHSHKDSA